VSQPDDFAPPGSRAVNAECRGVANDRATDAGADGMDDATQQQVFNLVYADCADWHARQDAQFPVVSIK
jgi:hypothetical protein